MLEITTFDPEPSLDLLFDSETTCADIYFKFNTEHTIFQPTEGTVCVMNCK